MAQAPLHVASILNKLRKGDPENVTRWATIINQHNTKSALQLMIDLCLKRRGWTPIFCECLASTPHLFQHSHTTNALDPPLVQLVLRECLDYNDDDTFRTSEEISAREICLLDLVKLLLSGLPAPVAPGWKPTLRPVATMDVLSLIQHIILPCLRPGHPNVHLGLLLTQLALQYWNSCQSSSVVTSMLKSSLIELAVYDPKVLLLLRTPAK